jgi:hypothetical protein
VSGSIPQVDSPALLGVEIPRSALHEECERLVVVAKHAAKRALLELKKHAPPEDELAATLMEAESKKLSAISRLADTADHIVRGLLAEQRARAELAAKRASYTDESFLTDMRAMLREMSIADIMKLRGDGMDS